jgi:hypothetical protein
LDDVLNGRDIDDRQKLFRHGLVAGKSGSPNLLPV